MASRAYTFDMYKGMSEQLALIGDNSGSMNG